MPGMQKLHNVYVGQLRKKFPGSETNKKGKTKLYKCCKYE